MIYNIRGARPKKHELSEIDERHNLEVIALKEAHLEAGDNLHLKDKWFTEMTAIKIKKQPPFWSKDSCTQRTKTKGSTVNGCQLLRSDDGTREAETLYMQQEKSEVR